MTSTRWIRSPTSCCTAATWRSSVRPRSSTLGAQILKNLKAPVRMMVGEHDWYLDMGEKWRELFGEPSYSFDHKGVHFVVLNSVIEEDFWTARKLTPMERMKTVAGLDNGVQRPFTVGAGAARLAAEGSGQGHAGHAAGRVLALAAVQALQAVELLDRRRRGGAGASSSASAASRSSTATRTSC